MLEAFIKIRKKVTITKSTGNVRFYTVKGNKVDHITECVEIRTHSKWDPKYQNLPDMPVEPIRPGIDVEREDTGGGATIEGEDGGEEVGDANVNMDGDRGRRLKDLKVLSKLVFCCVILFCFPPSRFSVRN